MSSTAAIKQRHKMATTTNSTSTMDDDLEHVFELMVSRSRGEAQTDEVEEAVSKLLQKSNPTPAAAVPKQQPQPQVNPEIQQDLDDYDNLDKEPQEQTKPSATNTQSLVFQQATLESMLREEENVNPLEQIPLGIMGGRMMVTFGDGPHPKPSAVQEALLGARRCLLIAIKDARALRRHEKEEYDRARKIAILSSKQGKLRGGKKLEPQDQAASTSIMYRAMQGYDKLAYDPKCGFDVEQLQQLFPEEMQAFQKWNEMHNSYQQSSEETGVAEDTTSTNGIINAAEQQQQQQDNDSTTTVAIKPAVSVPSDVPVAEGHLEERAAQFDARTDQMKKEWYLKFSEVRKGSFLPKSGMKRADEREWNARQKKKRGRPKAAGTSWHSMSATSVRFLHWIGFDPQSSLPPPNEEVTEALAFLAYDFMGRIVEKAIYLRNVANEKENENSLLELVDGEQLEAQDIRKAINNDSTIKPVPLFSSLDNDKSSSMPVAASLYFGPGFEDRLEMEMEELASGKKRKRLSPQELEIRQREDELFAKLAKEPPAFDGFVDVLNDEAEEVEVEGDSTSNKKAKGTNGKKK